MRRVILSVAAVAGLASVASAQPSRNVITNSGNGVGNTITARNGPGIQLYAPQGAAYTAEPFQQEGYGPAYSAGYTPAPALGGVSRNVIRDSGNGANNTIIARNGPGVQQFAPTAYGGYAPGDYSSASYAPQFGGYATSGYPQAGYAPLGFQQRGYAPPFGGYASGGFYPQPGGLIRNLVGGLLPGGVNVNLISNSGNGVGNTIRAGNGRPGGLNFNIITNSGNGVGNVIGARNR